MGISHGKSIPFVEVYIYFKFEDALWVSFVLYRLEGNKGRSDGLKGQLMSDNYKLRRHSFEVGDSVFRTIILLLMHCLCLILRKIDWLCVENILSQPSFYPEVRKHLSGYESGAI